MKIDVHQHLWSEPLIGALRARRRLPFVRVENGLTVLFLASERPYVIDRGAEDGVCRAELVERDGLDAALLCISSPIGIESLPRDQAEPLLGAYHEGALAAGARFGVWGAIALHEPDPRDVDRALERGCAGISLPAGAIASRQDLHRLGAVLERLEARDAPLFVHPGRGRGISDSPPAGHCLSDPVWWPALTSYVSGIQMAWLAFGLEGRRAHPRLRVVYSMLAGLAPLHGERIRSRGGQAPVGGDELTFYETSSYGPAAIAAVASVVGPGQLLYGSDRPVVEPGAVGMPAGLDWAPVIEGTRRALGPFAERLA